MTYFLWVGLICAVFQILWCYREDELYKPKTYEFMSAVQMALVWIYFLSKGT